MKNSKIAVLLIGIAFLCIPLSAQYQGDQLPGLAGLQAGSQPGPGIYVTVPLYFGWSNISINDAQGNRVLKDASGEINLFVLPAVQVVTPFKILGANYGAAYTEWINNGVINVASANFQRSTSYAFGDIYVQPLILGWHFSHADVTAGYSFFAPTGGSNGQEMWVNELNLGGTVHAGPGKKFNASTMMYYDFNRKKNDADIKVGDIVTLAGGIGRSFLKGAGNAGVAYGAQWKTTHDSGSDIPALLPITDGRTFGVGPEITVPVFAKGLNIGLVSFRYEWLVGPKTALGGQVLTSSFTFAKLRHP